MAGTPHILVVDDEEDLRDMVQEYLGRHGFDVSTADGGVEMRQILNERPADLVILDINMPGEDGISLARYLRQQGNAGIIMLTANGEVVDRVVGLEVGADDYVTKPFDLRELLARVRTVLRRTSRSDSGGARLAEHEVRFGRCILNLDSRKLTSLEGEDVPITAMEYDLLRAFAENPNRALSRDRLLDIAHNREMDAFDRSIDTRILRIRRKIELDPEKPQVIKTVRGSGYIFVPGDGGTQS